MKCILFRLCSLLLNSWTSFVNTLIHTNCFTCWRFFALSCGWQRAGITLTFYNTLKFHTWQFIYTEMRENVCVSLCVCVCVREEENVHLHVHMHLSDSWLTAQTLEWTSDRHGREVKDTEGRPTTGSKKPWSERSDLLFFFLFSLMGSSQITRACFLFFQH